MSLLQHVRDLTSIPSSLVPDAVVLDALARHRVWNDAHVDWMDARTGEARVWGLLDTTTRRVLDTNDDDVDVEAAGATVDQRGAITLADDGTEPAWRVAGYGFDVNLAAAEVCDAAAAALATAFDFSTDGQSFSRSQQTAAYQGAAARFRSMALPRVQRMRRADDDVAANVQRVAGRRRGA